MRKSFPNRNSRLDTCPSCDRVSQGGSGAWYRQGELLANQQRYAEALVCFDHALEQQVDSDAAWIFRGVMLIYLEDYREALNSCERAIALHPHNPEAWIFRGVALHRLGCCQQAYASYDQALGIHWGTRRSSVKRSQHPIQVLKSCWATLKRWRMPWLL